MVKNAGFGVRLSGFLSTLTGYVTLQNLHSLSVSASSSLKMEIKIPTAQNGLGQCFSNKAVVKD